MGSKQQQVNVNIKKSVAFRDSKVSSESRSNWVSHKYQSIRGINGDSPVPLTEATCGFGGGGGESSSLDQTHILLRKCQKQINEEK